MISIIGARSRMRSIIKKVTCRLLTSLVMRVISEAVLNWSMLANEKPWTFSKSASRKFAPKPILTLVVRRVLTMPIRIAPRASNTMYKPM